MFSSAEQADSAKNAIDILFVGLVVGTVMEWLPSIAAVLTVLWLGVRLLNEILVTVSKSWDLRRRRRTGD